MKLAWPIWPSPSAPSIIIGLNDCIVSSTLVIGFSRHDWHEWQLAHHLCTFQVRETRNQERKTLLSVGKWVEKDTSDWGPG